MSEPTIDELRSGVGDRLSLAELALCEMSPGHAADAHRAVEAIFEAVLLMIQIDRRTRDG